MSIDQDKKKWQSLLESLTVHPAERSRVAEALGVNPFTITRWISGESEPRLKNLRQLPNLFPEQKALFEEFIDEVMKPPVPGPLILSASYLARILAVVAETSGPVRAWTIRHLAFLQLLQALDPSKNLGIEISIAQCTPPQERKEPIQSVCERLSIGTGPWKSDIERKLLFLGSESLAGWAVDRGEPGIIQDLERADQVLPFRPGIYEKSAAAFPLRRGTSIAGCLLIVSAQAEYFSSDRLSYLETYANVCALSFRDDEFFTPILLKEIPCLSPTQQQQLQAHFRLRIREIRRTSDLSEQEAEKRVLQEIERVLLQNHQHAFM